MINKKYSISVSHIPTIDKWSLVVTSWELNEDGERVNEERKNKLLDTFTEVKEKINKL
jgi:hypothetical protein